MTDRPTGTSPSSGRPQTRPARIPVRPARTVVAAVVGGAVGAVVAGYATGQVISMTGDGEATAWAALGASIIAAAVGAFLGAAAALAVAFRDEPGRPRAATVATTLLAGPVILVVLGGTAGRIQQDWNLPPLWLAVALVTSALLGRWIATRTGRGS